MSSFHVGELKVKSEQRQALLDSLEMLKEQKGFIANTCINSTQIKIILQPSRNGSQQKIILIL